MKKNGIFTQILMSTLSDSLTLISYVLYIIRCYFVRSNKTYHFVCSYEIIKIMLYFAYHL